MKLVKRGVKFLLGRFGYEIQKKRPEWWEPIGLEGLIPPRHLWVNPGDPLYWFFGYPWEYRVYLTLLAGLRKDASVLEIGCHHGRTMLMLLMYLEPPGSYEGLDIMPEQIEFAQRNIHAHYPLANFTLADVHNSLYNPKGKVLASEYRFPYSDSSFDIVYAASVFTHLVPKDAANYLKETRRVLRGGGKALFSFFIFDYYRGPGTSTCQFYEFPFQVPDFEGAFVQRSDLPESVIAYKISSIKEMSAQAGLEVKQIVPGFWSKSHPVGVNEQDLVLFEAV